MRNLNLDFTQFIQLKELLIDVSDCCHSENPFDYSDKIISMFNIKSLINHKSLARICIKSVSLDTKSSYLNNAVYSGIFNKVGIDRTEVYLYSDKFTCKSDKENVVLVSKQLNSDIRTIVDFEAVTKVNSSHIDYLLKIWNNYYPFKFICFNSSSLPSIDKIESLREITLYSLYDYNYPLPPFCTKLCLIGHNSNIQLKGDLLELEIETNAVNLINFNKAVLNKLTLHYCVDSNKYIDDINAFTGLKELILDGFNYPLTSNSFEIKRLNQPSYPSISNTNEVKIKVEKKCIIV